jgi:NADH-quinone oxidoreductase subunit G
MQSFGAWDGERVSFPASSASSADAPGARADALLDASHYVLATWKQLIDDGRMLDGEEYLKATGRRPALLVSPDTLAHLGVHAGQLVTIASDRGSVELPVGVADLPDGVVWAPASSGGVSLCRELGVSGSGAVVRLEGVVPSLSKEGHA